MKCKVMLKQKVIFNGVEVNKGATGTIIAGKGSSVYYSNGKYPSNRVSVALSFNQPNVRNVSPCAGTCVIQGEVTEGLSAKDMFQTGILVSVPESAIAMIIDVNRDKSVVVSGRQVCNALGIQMIPFNIEANCRVRGGYDAIGLINHIEARILSAKVFEEIVLSDTYKKDATLTDMLRVLSTVQEHRSAYQVIVGRCVRYTENLISVGIVHDFGGISLSKLGYR